MPDKIFVPPIKIQGIKTKLVPIIKQNISINDNTLWLEPFMGSGVVGFNMRPKRAIFADINPHIIHVHGTEFALSQAISTNLCFTDFLGFIIFTFKYSPKITSSTISGTIISLGSNTPFS